MFFSAFQFTEKCKQYREIKDQTQIQINAHALHTTMEVNEMWFTGLSNISFTSEFFY